MMIRWQHEMTAIAARIVGLMALAASAASLWGQSPAVSPTSMNVLAGGGVYAATVTIASGTSWSASSNASWLTFPNGSSGTGSGSLTYRVAQNSASSGQSGTITVTSGGGSAALTVTEAAFASGGPTAAFTSLVTSGSPAAHGTLTLTA